MRVTSLHDLFVEELQDLFDAEQQTVQALPDLAASARQEDLKRALLEHVDQSRMHIERIRLICRERDVPPEGEPCAGMRGLLLGARSRLADITEGDVRDAAIIGAAQRVEHYEIAAYGCARAYASELGHFEAVTLLQQTLDEEGEADKRLTRIAERRVNVEAVRQTGRGTFAGPPARLRYVALDALPSVNYTGMHAVNRFNERVGDLSGFIVDGTTGRPYYLVIDSGGVFRTRQYLVPVGRSRADLGARAVRIDVQTDTLAKYPEFNDARFERMTDEEIDRYERAVLDAIAPREEGWTGRPDYDQLPDYQADWIALDAWSDADRDAQRPPVIDRSAPAQESRPPAATPFSTPPSRDRELTVARGDAVEPAEHPPDPGRRIRERIGEDERGKDTQEEPPRPPKPTIDRSR